MLSLLALSPTCRLYRRFFRHLSAGTYLAAYPTRLGLISLPSGVLLHLKPMSCRFDLILKVDGQVFL